MSEKRATVLVVDDAFDIREPLAKFLDKNGFRAITADFRRFPQKSCSRNGASEKKRGKGAKAPRERQI